MRPVPAAIPADTSASVSPVRPHRARRIVPIVVAAALLLLGIRAGQRWWQARQVRLPAGIAAGNGRLEADEIDIDTKLAARVAQLFVNEGDFVHAGQPVARMDTRDVLAQRENADAQLAVATHALEEAQANVTQQETQVDLASKERDRYAALVREHAVSQEEFDERQQASDAAVAALAAATAHVAQAQHAVDAARRIVQLDQVYITDDTLLAPHDGRIEYRISNLGEVLPAGGKVFTMLDATSVYMDIYIPSAEAGRVRLGAPARILLDAYPARPISSVATFLASEAQFTPKAVETKDERDRLMFRVRVRVEPGILAANETAIRSGLPGMAYVQLDPTTAWPAWLTPRE